MITRRLSRAAFCILSLFVLLNTGCWGRKFFRMPRETIETSADVDSLLAQVGRLERRLYRVEKAISVQRDYGRSVNAQLKIDLEEIKDQVNALRQMLSEAAAGSSQGFDWGRIREPDAAGKGPRSDAEEGEREDEIRGGEGSETVPGGVMPIDTVPTGELFTGQDTLPGEGVGLKSVTDTSITPPGESVPPPQDIHRQVYLDFRRGQYELALEESDLFLNEYPDHPLGEDIRFIRGECFVELGKHFDALKEFRAVLQQYPKGSKAPSALFRMAVSYESIGEREIAAGVVRRLVREYPYSEEAGAAEERFHDLLK